MQNYNLEITLPYLLYVDLSNYIDEFNLKYLYCLKGYRKRNITVFVIPAQILVRLFSGNSSTHAPTSPQR